MRIFSYIFHGLLALFLLALASLALIGGDHNLQLGMLPWTGKALTYWIFCLSLFGLAALALALKGVLRVLFFVWSLVVLGLLLKGYYLGSYFFRPGEFSTAVYLTVGAILAAVGAWFQLSRRDTYKKRAY